MNYKWRGIYSVETCQISPPLGDQVDHVSLDKIRWKRQFTSVTFFPKLHNLSGMRNLKIRKIVKHS